MTILSMRSLLKSTYAIPVLACVLVSCGGVKAYSGPERPASEVSVVKCGFSLAMVAVDENRSFFGRPILCEFSLLPGKHTFRVKIEKKEQTLTWVQKGDQVVEYELKAGKTYSLHAFEKDIQKSPGLWTISIGDPVTNKFVPLKQVNLR